MNTEYWVDGFNFFHHWEKSRELLLPESGMDIARSLERALRIFSRELGTKRRATLVFLDGGLNRCEARQAGLRVRYCGPGNKADDRMVENLADLGPDAKAIVAVSNDRELRGRLAFGGASCLGVGEFLSLLANRSGAKGGNGKFGRAGKGGIAGKGGDQAEILREKCRNLSPAEVRAWLDAFGGDVEG